MLTLQEVEGGKTKCARYWPDQDVTDEYGGFAELNIIEETGKDYTLRQFLVSRKTRSRGRYSTFTSWAGQVIADLHSACQRYIFRSRHSTSTMRMSSNFVYIHYCFSR